MESESPSQLADSLQWVAYALLLGFFAQAAFGFFPLALTQPAWLERASAGLRATATLPMLAIGLLMLANWIDEEVKPSSRHLLLLRRLSTLVAIGYLLLIPLQSYAAVANIRIQVAQAQEPLNRLVQAGRMLQQASTEEQLRAAIRLLPDGEQLADRPLGAELVIVKASLLERVRPTIKRLENQLKTNQNQAYNSLVSPLLRDALVCISYALGFASMGFSGLNRPTPLRRLIRPHAAILRIKPLGAKQREKDESNNDFTSRQ